MLDLKTCPKCSKLTAIENDVCPYCGNYFDKNSQKSVISPQYTDPTRSEEKDFTKPIITPDSAPPGDWKSVWNELNSFTQWVTLILIPLAILGNPIGGIVGAAIGYFWLGPWAATFAKEHNRNINWAYFYGFAFVLIGCGIYWLYVKITTDPLHPTVSSGHRGAAVGEWVVLALSFIYAFLITFSEGIGGSLADISGFFIGSFILSLIVLYIIYWIIGKLLPGSKYWSVVVWILAIIGIPFVIFIILAVGAAFVFGMAGSIPAVVPGGSITYSTYENPGLGYQIKYPDTWTFKTFNEPDATYITDTTFSDSDGKRGFFVQVVDLSGTAYEMNSLDEWSKNGIAILRSNKEFSQLTILKNERTMLSGYPSQRLEYTYVINTGVKLRSVQYLMIKGTKGYNVALFSTDDEFGAWSDVGQEIVNSFKITA